LLPELHDSRLDIGGIELSPTRAVSDERAAERQRRNIMSRREP
jgi:hypothetical protein